MDEFTPSGKNFTLPPTGSDKYHLCSAFIQIFVNIPIVANHVCLKYLEQLCFVPAVVWCQLRIPESPSRPELELEYNGRRIAPGPGPRSSLAPTQIQFLRYLFIFIFIRGPCGHKRVEEILILNATKSGCTTLNLQRTCQIVTWQR